MIVRSRRALRAVAAEYVEAIGRFTRNARLFLVALGIQSIGVGILLTVFAIYVKGAGLSEAVVGDVEGSLALASAAVCLIAPPLVAVFGYRRLLVVAAALFGAARLGQAGMPEAGLMLGFGMVYGLGEGVMQSVPVPFLTENSSPAERSHLYTADLIVRVGLCFVGGVLGGLLPTMLTGLLGEVDAYRATVAVAALLFLVSCAPLALIRERVGHPRHAFRTYVQTMRQFSSWRHIGRLLVPQVLISVGAGLIIPFLSLYLKRHLGATIFQVGLIQGVSELAMGVAALGAPLLARRFGFVRATALAEAASIPFLAAIPFVTSLPVAAVVFWLRGAFMNMSWPTWNQFTMERVPARERPVVAGVIAFGYSAAWLAGSALGGRLMAYSYTVPYAIATVLYTLGALTTWLMLRRHDDVPGSAPV
ncbi:MAG: MFS transporter [Coriobacteriia bacterium]|nr:MFS transporter [Coriobacteriia bacterium]